MRLLITRPEPDASTLAAELAALGHEAIIAPLMDVRFTDAVPDISGVQALAATSANGVRALERFGDATKHLPLYAVGPATAKAARDAGFAQVQEAGGDASLLAFLIAASCDPARGAILHVAGKKIAGDLKGDLETEGFTVRRAVLYEADAAETLPEAAVTAIAQRGADGVLLFSPRTARLFVSLARDAGLADQLDGLTAYCLSEAVATALGGAAFGHVIVAAMPRTEDLLACL